MKWLFLILVLAACKPKTTQINGETFGVIPGTDLSRIRTELQRNGFQSFKDDNQQPVSYSFVRDDRSREDKLVLSGSNPSNIVGIEATHISLDSTINDRNAKNFLGWIAEIPRGDRKAARFWLERNLYGYDIDTVISGVRFNIKTKSNRISFKIRSDQRY